MRSEFDVSRSGSHWKISNGRSHYATCLLSSIKNKKLKINRSTSTSNYKAEIVGSCTIELLNTPIGHAMSIDAWIKTVISDSGKITISRN